MKFEKMIEQFYWVTKFGFPKRKITSEALYVDPSRIEHPVFFLSTGRTGTEWFTHLLKSDNSLGTFHNPLPNLSVQNKFIYEIARKEPLIDFYQEIGKQLFLTAREQYLRHAYKAEKRYVETNNHITFFAPILADLFPSAKFVHLYRHPGDFVTSGLNRGWFETNESATEKMITHNVAETWSAFSAIEKISWVWNETNRFIETFKDRNSSRVFTYNFSERSVDRLTELIDFLGVAISKQTLNTSLEKKRNVQKTQQYAPYAHWDRKDKNSLIDICKELSEKYHFTL